MRYLRVKVGNRDSISFKSHYMVKGSTANLAEVSSRLQHISKKTAGSQKPFDFVAVRLTGTAGPTRNQILGPVSLAKATALTVQHHLLKQLPKDFTDKALLIGESPKEEGIVELVSPDDAVTKSLGLPKTNKDDESNCDLILVGDDKRGLLLGIRQLVEESVKALKLKGKELASAIVQEQDSLVTNLRTGRPILNINPDLLKANLPLLCPNVDLSAKPLDSTKVIVGIEAGNFDVFEGKSRQNIGSSAAN